MKKLFALALVLVLCMTSFAFAEDYFSGSNCTDEALQAEADGKGTLSVRIACMVNSSTIEGWELNTSISDTNKLPLVITTNKENYAINACEDHVKEVREVEQGRVKRFRLGEDIANALLPYNFFVCIAGDINGYSGEGNIRVEVYSEYAYAVKRDDIVMMVVCIPDDLGTYQYELLQGQGLGDNKVECVIPASVARRLPTDKPTLFDFFAK